MNYDEFEKLMDEEIDKAIETPEYDCKPKIREYYKEYVETLRKRILNDFTSCKSKADN